MYNRKYIIYKEHFLHVLTVFKDRDASIKSSINLSSEVFLIWKHEEMRMLAFGIRRSRLYITDTNSISSNINQDS